MASNSARLPIFRVFSIRNFSAQVKPATCATSDIKLSTLPNKLIVVSADCINNGLVKVSVAVRAGSRYESPDNFGVSHIVRASTGLATASASKFNIMRNIHQMGSTLTATSDHETIVYTLETTCNNLSKGLNYLKYVTCEPCFKPWELSDNIPRIEYELAHLSHSAIVMDNLHYAAYRRGLGNSIFVKPYNIKKLSSETVQHFVNQTFHPSKAAVAGVGIDHETLENFAKSLSFPEGQSESSHSEYHGGEIRNDCKSNLAHVAIAAETPGLNKKEVFSYAILRCALGGSSSVKWGHGASPIARALKNPSSGHAFHSAHSDSGLLGVVVTSPSGQIREAVTSVAKVLKEGLKEDDIARGKKQLIAEVLYNGENCGFLSADIAIQGVLVRGARSSRQLAEAVDQVSVGQVFEAFKKISSGKKSIASVGEVHDVPYLDEIE